jgi:hypothetical protein
VPPCGASLVLPVADAALAESEGPDGALALVLAFALADDEALCVGVDEDLAAAVDAWLCAGAGLVQLELGIGWTLFLADPVELGLALVLALDDVVGVTDGEPPGLALGVSLALGLTLALPDGLELTLAVLLVLPLEDVAGAVVVAVVPLGGSLLADVADECADGDGQALREGGPATAALLDDTPPAAEGVSRLVLWPSVAGGDPLAELLLLKAEPMASPTFIIPWRVAGTTDRTTPTANTAAPTAKAGLSMASRQSLGRCGGRRPGACCPDACRSGTRKPRRRNIPAATPETPSQTPRIHRGWLACAGRDRILSRIRSRPSEPGST